VSTLMTTPGAVAHRRDEVRRTPQLLGRVDRLAGTAFTPPMSTMPAPSATTWSTRSSAAPSG
jgi:hypothetical protein